MATKFCQIAIAGNIGAGKTTLTQKLSKDLNIKPIFESVDDNPYLELFYNNMSRWSFNLQIFFLHKRFSNQLDLINSKQSFVQDRSIYEDREIFAKNLNDMKLMSNIDWDTYCNLFNDMIQFIDHPDLIIYLKASTNTLISRIKNIDLIDSIYVQELTKDYTRLRIKYLGKLENIINQLKNQNIDLKLIGDNWIIKVL